VRQRSHDFDQLIPEQVPNILRQRDAEPERMTKTMLLRHAAGPATSNLSIARFGIAKICQLVPIVLAADLAP
jgi:hypothetical protein